MKTTFWGVGFLSRVVLLGATVSAQAVTFTSDTFISSTNTDYEGMDVAVSNCTVTIDGAHGFSSVHVFPGGVVTHPAGSPTGVSLTVSNDFQIEPGGIVSAAGQGFGPGSGPGAGGSVLTNFPFPFFAGAGGSYAGFGGGSASGATGGVCYASIVTPTNSGSGGGAGSGPGGAGGGMVQLIVGGLLRVDGQLSADGQPGTNGNSGGGSGGSLYLAAQTVSGGGTISANGGSGEPLDGGGGGGGVVAVYSDTNVFAGTIMARGGAGWSYGGAGAVYTAPRGVSAGQLLVDNGGNSGAATALSDPTAFYLTISGGAVVQSTTTTILNQLTIRSNSWLTFVAGQVSPLTVVGDVQIDAGGGVTADGTGSAGGLGTGAGHTASVGNNTAGSGGGYGGIGGQSSTGAGGGGLYGTPDLTTNVGGGLLGSGGGAGKGTVGGAGGGLAQLVIGGNLVLNGRISANGVRGGGNGSGGGSGGGVCLVAGTISGTGSISANGGPGEQPLGGGGGGGRVAVYFNTNLFAGNMSAFGGTGWKNGGAGTIYVKRNVLGGLTQVIVDNGGLASASNTVVAVSGDLILRGGASVFLQQVAKTLTSLRVESNCLLVLGQTPGIAQVLTVTSNVIVQAGGAISVDGLGFGAGQGQGGGRQGSTVFGTVGGGGGFGGTGGSGISNAAGGITYGAVSYVSGSGISAGSGGSPDSGGAGGGSVSLIVGGNLSIDGKISANGLPAPGVSGGGGSGGGLLLTAGIVSGSGSISANGGSGYLPYGGGGGGGRIQVYFKTNLFTGAITAYGAAGAVYGGAGTIVLTKPTAILPPISPTTGSLLIDNGGQAGAGTPIPLPVDRFDLTISGGAQAVISNFTPTISLGTLLIGTNSGLVCGNPSAQPPVAFSVTNNATIQGGGVISLNGTGLASQQGSGPGFTGAGGGHGGFGGASSSGAVGGGTYDSISQPGSAGSGGGFGSGGQVVQGGAGGGAFRLTVSRALVVDGIISADGTTGPGQGGGGGSGGSVMLGAGQFSGKGLISASGGSGDLPYGGGGGGGRIAIYYSTNQFTGTILARGGIGANAGGAGTFYSQASNSLSGQVVLDNAGISGARTPLNTQGTFDLTIRGGAAGVASGMTLGNLAVNSNSFLYCTSTAPQAILITASNATVQTGGGIVMDGFGYAGNTGTGVGRSGTTITGVVTGGGGGHGGPGGSSFYGFAGGFVYDSITQPTSWGSGGGNGTGITQSNAIGGAGGGGLQLNVSGSLTVDGRVSADGLTGPGQGSGGGAGGTLWFSVGRLAGGGILSANGGAGDLPLGGGGGGGRIALYFNTNQFTGVISARGSAGAGYGGAGTIYLRGTSNQNQIAQVTVDNGGTPSSSNTIVTGLGTIDLTVSGGAVVNDPDGSFRNLLINSNSWLTMLPASSIQKNLLVSGDATIQAGGGITMDGLGNPGGIGPGAPTIEFQTFGSGAGHGGYGGASSSGISGGNAYSLLTSPIEPGSGGGNVNHGTSPYNLGGAGGGSLHLTVAGTLSLNGSVSANGLAGVGAGSGGGSGGTVWMTTGRLTGLGNIVANGGAGDLPSGGGGGGGRVSVGVTGTNLFTGSFSARGGAGAVYGGAGTVYFVPPTRPGVPPFTNTFPQLVLDNGGVRGTNTPLSGAQGPTMDLTVSSGAVCAAQKGFASGVIRNLLVGSNSLIVGLPGQNQQLTMNLTGDATIKGGGGILLDGSGFALNSGTGRGGYELADMGGGGGYGGYGGSSLFGTAGGNGYGSIQQPTLSGSGGGAFGGSQTSGSSAGGGILRLNLEHGNLRVDGTISANGNGPLYGSGGFEGDGGGAGGSVWLTVGTLTGSGVISANGGPGDPGQGGGGGGGRVAVYYTSNQFSGVIAAEGGSGAVAGGAGTVYTKRNLDPVGTLLVENGGQQGTNTPLSTTEALKLSVLNGAIVNPSGGGIVLSNLLVDGGGMLTHLATQSNLDITTLGNAVFGTNGSIVVDGDGYGAFASGPGAGQMTNSFSGSGAGYGGAGGAGISGIPGGSTYGSATQPTDDGSQGGVFPALSNYCQGGGAIRLKVGGTLTVNGRLSANGNEALVEGAGGGSGGSIWITTRRLDGTGLLLANGGMGEADQGGGGGGGRIAVYARTNNFGGALAAYGGFGASWGGTGTIFITNVIPPPQVVAQTPTGIVSYAVGTVDLTFGSPLDAVTVPGATTQLDTPNGLLAPGSVTPSSTGLSSVQVSFPSQNTVGYYELHLGPQVADIYGDSMAGVYVGSFVILPPVISGQVTDTNGVGVPYVTLRISDQTLPSVTDANGRYALEVLPSWDGSITPSRGTSIFIPATRVYSNVGIDQTNQNFILTTPAALMMTSSVQGGNLNLGWYGINGVSYQVLWSADLMSWVPYNLPVLGTNGPVQVVIPVGTEGVMMFRFGASY